MISLDAPAKVNIFLKITGYREGYHTLISRFMRLPGLYDTVSFVPEACERFTVEGCEGVPRETNTIYKAFVALNDATGDLDILEFFRHHKVRVTKRIPQQAGLGGGSSDAAAFMLLVHRHCRLPLSLDELARIGSRVGADVPFFIYGFESANVSGFGEIVEAFDEPLLPLELFTPPVSCDTGRVYRMFHDRYLPRLRRIEPSDWLRTPSREILSSAQVAEDLNDLYLPALRLYPALEEYAPRGWFFSGSGSSFFRPKDAAGVV